MSLLIRNSHDLKTEIFRLERLEVEQGTALKARFNSPSAIASTVFSLFSNSSPGTEGSKQASFFNQDFLGLISRFVLPIALNKTLFKNSNFLIKTLVGVLSQKASHFISEDSVGSVWHKITALFEGGAGTKAGGIMGTVKSFFESKKQRKGFNHPSNVPVQQNVLKTE